MHWITTKSALEALYGTPSEASLIKVAHWITADYRRWIEAARFCVLSTSGPDGLDNSPRGDDGPVVAILDDHHLALPDWRGNNRLDSLRNIIDNPRVSLMFMLRGQNNVIRVNGQARLSASQEMRARFSRPPHLPKTVIVIEVDEIYFQCARALMRSRFWAGEIDGADLPSLGSIMERLSDGTFNGADYDRDWPSRAKRSMWSDEG